jgi:peptide/nickel transport system ATP-binding protein
MSVPVLEVENLRTAVPGPDGPLHPVDGVSFRIARGETFALLGESGCGKSFTALSIMRLLPDAAAIVGGRVRLDGDDLAALPERRMRDVRGHRVAMIFQEPGTSLDPVMTIGDQIGEVLERHFDMRGATARRRILELLDAVGIPDPARRIDEFPFQLSGGMKQRVMIAAALAGEPSLLIADEPTTALDVTIQAQVLDLLRDLQARLGMAMLLITHDLGIVARMAHSVGVMYAGRIVETAPAARFFDAPAHPYSRKLFDSLPTEGGRRGPLAVMRGTVPPLGHVWTGCRFAARCDHVRPTCERAEPALYAVEPDHEVRCVPEVVDAIRGARATRVVAEQASCATEVHTDGDAALLSIEDLRIHFPIRGGLLRRTIGQVRAVDGVTLSIAAGRTLALVGESGCGKTTVGKGILQLLPTAAGRIVFDGTDLARLDASALRARRQAFQIVFQDPFASLDPRMRVGEILEEGMVSLRPEWSAQRRGDCATELLEAVGLPVDSRDRYPHEFSGGQRQRIAIARALAVEPRLLVCDEPTSALDVSVQAQILNLLQDLQTRLGIAYLFITHNIAVVDHLAHEVAVMYLGRIVEQGPVDAVLRHPSHPYTEALLSARPPVAGQAAVGLSFPRALPACHRTVSGGVPGGHPPRIDAHGALFPLRGGCRRRSRLLALALLRCPRQCAVAHRIQKVDHHA